MGGIIIIWDPQVWTLWILEFDLSLCAPSLNPCFTTLFGVLFGVYGPNDDNVRSALFEEVVAFMSNWVSLSV